MENVWLCALLVVITKVYFDCGGGFSIEYLLYIAVFFLSYPITRDTWAIKRKSYKKFSLME